MKSAWMWSVVAVVATSLPAGARDRYEGPFTNFDEDDASTYVELLHGQVQTHDLEVSGTVDQDWTFVQETLHHSYEVRVMNTLMRFVSTPASFGVDMNRVDSIGNILTAGSPSNVYNGTFAVRWIAEPMAQAYSFIRVVGFAYMPAQPVEYDLQMRDTTYTIPRWNNANGQFTVFFVQNTTNRELTGKVYFYTPAGALLHTAPFSIPAYGLYVLNTGGLGPLAGKSGSAAIAHLGSYGALSGKAVALEPATGYSFDTPLTPIPY